MLSSRHAAVLLLHGSRIRRGRRRIDDGRRLTRGPPRGSSGPLRGFASHVLLLVHLPHLPLEGGAVRHDASLLKAAPGVEAAQHEHALARFARGVLLRAPFRVVQELAYLPTEGHATVDVLALGHVLKGLHALVDDH